MWICCIVCFIAVEKARILRRWKRKGVLDFWWPPAQLDREQYGHVFQTCPRATRVHLQPDVRRQTCSNDDAGEYVRVRVASK